MKRSLFMSLTLVLLAIFFLSCGRRSAEETHLHTETFTTEHIHSYREEVEKTADCTQEGILNMVCDCTDSYSRLIPPIGHDYGSWEVSEQPTADSTGLLIRVCDHDASHTQTAELPMLSAGDYSCEQISDTACVHTIRYLYVKDGQRISFEVSNEGEHAFTQWAVTVAPTMASSGRIERYCRTCDHSGSAILPMLSIDNGYSYQIIRVATPTSTGIGRFLIQIYNVLFEFDVVLYSNETEFDPR